MSQTQNENKDANCYDSVMTIKPQLIVVRFLIKCLWMSFNQMNENELDPGSL